MEHHKAIASPEGMKLLGQVRDICRRFPEVSERVDAFGHTSFRVGDKPFVIMGESGGTASLSIKTHLHTQELLLHQGGYTKTPYVGHHGWVTVQEGGPYHWPEIESLIEEGYLRTASKRLVKVYQSQEGMAP